MTLLRANPFLHNLWNRHAHKNPTVRCCTRPPSTFLWWSNHLDHVVRSADAVISCAMCSSISWNIAVPRTTRHRELFSGGTATLIYRCCRLFRHMLTPILGNWSCHCKTTRRTILADISSFVMRSEIHWESRVADNKTAACKGHTS